MRNPGSLLGSRLVRAAVSVVLLAGLVPTPALAVEAPAGLTIEANVLMDGHVRVGSWMAIDIRVTNTGPAISGELRLAGGAQGRTRFGTRVDLPTQSDKTYRLYAQPPAFGRDLEISLVDGNRTVATTSASFTVHDATQMVVGIVAEQPGDIVGDLDLLPNQNSVAPVTVPLTVGELPVRVEAWGVLDRLVWQDTDSANLSTEQIDALRGWVAGGGRLVIVGGTAGPASLSAFPDILLPYRPTATIDVEPQSLVALLGELAMRAIMRACIDAGGTITGEHGVGLDKLDYMPLIFSEDTLEAMCRLRDVFDPERRANPGKVVPVHSCREWLMDPRSRR